MKTTNSISQPLHVLLLALCGLSVYILLIALLCLVVGLVITTPTHAHAPPELGVLLSR